jgi:hypothetical protein
MVENPRLKDPNLNDDSQPSVTSSAEALRLADENAGIPPAVVLIKPPADAIDMEVRKARADVPVESVVAEVAPVGGGEDAGVASKAAADDEDFGTGSYEDRTNAQLAALAKSKGLATSGSKEDLIARLRG